MESPVASAAGGSAAQSIEAPPRAERALIEVRSDRRRLMRDALRELWDFREVLWAFTIRFVKVKYKQAAVGVGWAVLQPVLSAAVFALVLGRLAHVPSNGAPYLLFMLAGMTGWTYFSTALSTAAMSLVTDQAMLRKIYFPREVIPLAAIGAALVDFLPALITLAVVGALYGAYPTIAWVALPVSVAILVLTATGIGLGFAALNVYYRDVKHALPFVLQLGLLASAVVFPLSVFPAPWETVYGILNPVAGGIEALRSIVVQGHWPDLAITAGALGWAAVLVVVNYLFFKRLERSFGDRV